MTRPRAAAARRRRPSAAPSSFLMRLSASLTHVILLAQVLGLLANFLWYWEIYTADMVGFVYVGGDIAGLFAYFAFMLFAVLLFWLAPRRFWVSLHPVTLGLALVMLASHRLWGANAVGLALAAVLGALVGRYIYRFVLLYPRAALLLTALCVPLLRFFTPRPLAPYMIICAGMLLITLVCAAPLLRRLQPR